MNPTGVFFVLATIAAFTTILLLLRACTAVERIVIRLATIHEDVADIRQGTLDMAYGEDDAPDLIAMLDLWRAQQQFALVTEGCIANELRRPTIHNLESVFEEWSSPQAVERVVDPYADPLGR